MKKTLPRILFFGNERLATGVHSRVPTLEALLAHGYDVAAVVVAQHEPGQTRRARELEVAAVAGRHGLPLLAPDDLGAAREQLASFGAAAAVLIAYGRIVPPAVLDLFPRGIVNIHPSLLPKHRGPAPIENAILEDARATGVTLMRLVPRMDAGPLYAQTHVPLSGRETKQALADRLSAVGADMVLEHLPAILDGTLEPQPQDETAATADRLITKADGTLDFRKPALTLTREVRAYAGWPRSRARLGPTEAVITEAHVEPGRGPAGSLWREAKKFGFYTTDDILVIDKLVPAGKREMPAAAFLAGYHF